MPIGISVDYYASLERGNLRGVSDSVLDALARALRLDDAERAHLHDLARTANETTASRSRAAKTVRTPRDPVRENVRAILAGMTGTPAYVRNARMDILAANTLCTVLYDGILDPDALPVNLARFVFLDRSHDWQRGGTAEAANYTAQGCCLRNLTPVANWPSRGQSF